MLVLRGLIPRRTTSCGVWYSASQNPAGYQTPQNEVLRGITPRGTTLNTNISEYWNRIQKYFRVWIWGLYRFDSWKKPEAENLVLLSLSVHVDFFFPYSLFFFSLCTMLPTGQIDIGLVLIIAGVVLVIFKECSKLFYADDPSKWFK
jgi:hypothetical protein